MNQSLGPAERTLPGAGIWWETRASLAFVERNLYLVKRYWHLELAFLIFNVASAMSVLYIGEAQMQREAGSVEARVDLVLYLGIGTVVWAYLRAVFSNVGEMVAWERWEGTIEYTLMAPIHRITHMGGQTVFAIVYSLVFTAIVLGANVLMFHINLANANLFGGLVMLLAGSFSFVGLGIMGSILPLLFPERGQQMTHVIIAIMLLVSGVYYPISVLPPFLRAASTFSPATYVLQGARDALLKGSTLPQLWPSIWPTLIMGVIMIPAGLWVFRRAEVYAKRTGKLHRNG